jgi:hypothetical protein
VREVQGQGRGGDEGSITLRRLILEGGKTYYLRYRGYFVQGPGLVSFLDEVDEDEGKMLVQGSDHVTSTPKK